MNVIFKLPGENRVECAAGTMARTAHSAGCAG